MKATLLLSSIVVLACVAVAPFAGAAGYTGPGGPGAGGPVLTPNELVGQELFGGPGAGGPMLASDLLGYEPAGGPGAGGPSVPLSTATTVGLEWESAVLGGVFVLGLVLLAAGLAARWRWRRHGRQPQLQV